MPNGITLAGILTSWGAVFQNAENTVLATGGPPLPPLSQGLISFAQAAPTIPIPGIGQAGLGFPNIQALGFPFLTAPAPALGTQGIPTPTQQVSEVFRRALG